MKATLAALGTPAGCLAAEGEELLGDTLQLGSADQVQAVLCVLQYTAILAWAPDNWLAPLCCRSCR